MSQDEKKCSKCNEVKQLDQFPKKQNKCKLCVSIIYKLWYENNKEEIAAKAKKYYADNKQRQAATNKIWRENNKEKVALTKKAWEESHKEERATSSKIYRKNNKELIAKRQKEWYEKNKEEKLAYNKNWRDNNKEHKAMVSKTWYENNKERAAIAHKAWLKSNPEKCKLYDHNRRALKTSTLATLTIEEWEETWQEFDGHCFWCGDDATTMEHIVPLQPRRGELQGHHTKGNAVPACSPCNSSKHNMDPLRFYFKRQMKKNNLEGAEK